MALESDISPDVPVVAEVKPKRQLTEAQRLAFLKGREKRLANIARKREEKLEMERAIETKPVDAPVSPPPLEKITERPAPTAIRTPDFNPDEIADKVASLVHERIKSELPPPPPPKKPRKPRTPRAAASHDDAPPPPPVQRQTASFQWM